MSANPFGTDIRDTDILEDLGFFDDWEDRYRYVIELGKALPDLPEDKRTAANKARDAARRPVETLTFWGLRPGLTVIEPQAIDVSRCHNDPPRSNSTSANAWRCLKVLLPD